MENPATWGKAERIIHKIRRAQIEEVQAGDFRAGLSLERQITNALREAGLLRDEEDDG